MKHFSYKIVDTTIHKHVLDDFSEYNTYEDIRNKIALDLNADPSQLTITNKPNEQLHDILPGYEFLIDINNCCNDIEFLLQNQKIVKIINCNKMSNNEVILKLKEHGFHYSPSCIENNLYFTVSGKEITNKEFPFLTISPGSIIEVQMRGKFITIPYIGKEFTFSENEKIENVRELICKAFNHIKYCRLISIGNVESRIDYYNFEKIQCGVNYTINYPYYFIFRNISNHQIRSSQRMDLSSTVLDAKKRLSTIFCDHGELQPENIKIFNASNQEIRNENQFLIEIVENDSFIYFDIIQNSKPKISNDENKSEEKFQINQKRTTLPQNLTKIESSESNLHSQIKTDSNDTKSSIEIDFLFDESNEKKYEPFSQTVLLNTTVENLIEEIRKKFNINKKIQIQRQYENSKIPIEKDIKIVDIVDEIKEKTQKGEIKNILYIKIIQNQRKKASLFKPKTKPVSDDESTNHQAKQKMPKDDKMKNDQSINSMQTYTFEFMEKEQKLELSAHSYLKDNEMKIKKEFGIHFSEKLEFIIRDENGNEEKFDEIDKRTMESLINSRIKILILKNDMKSSEENDQKAKEEEEDKHKYFYQTNRDDEVQEIELKIGTNVKQFKEKIAENYGVSNLANIKIIFAGKDLLNDIVLDELTVGDTVLFIYIRTEEDIFLMTAKALRIGNEEEEEDNEDSD